MDDITTPSPANDSPADNLDNITVENSTEKAEETSTVGSILSSSKTQLAIGVAATLGVMIFYKWRERQLAEKEPEEYARLQRIKASVRQGEPHLDPDDDDDLTGADAASFQPTAPEAATGTGK